MIDLRPRTLSHTDSGRSPAELRPVPAWAADGTGRTIAWIGLVVALLTAAMALAPDGPPLLRAPIALAFVCLGPGAALLSHWRSREPVVAWALVVLVSLAGFAAGATALAWTGWWQPRPAALAGAVIVAVSCLVALARTAPGPRVRLRWRPDRATAGHLAVLAAGAGLWLAAVAGTDLAGVGEFGLLATVHPAFFAALLLCAGGFVAALRRGGGGRGPVLGGYLVLLVLILHGTSPLLLDQPEYAWTYKHLGVVELLSGNGGLTDSGDIYQQWPSLFAAVAGLADLSGVASLSLAHWAPVFFNLAGALVVLAIGRTLSTDRRVAYLAVFLFLCLNWIQEDYLSPQAFAYLLSLGVLLVALRWLRRPPGTRRGRRGWLARLYTGLPPAPAVPPRERAAALAVLVLLFAVLTASHQLSPYLVVGQLLVLLVLRLIRPWWMVPLLAGIVVAYLLPRYGLVSGSFDVFESLNIFGNAAGNADGLGSAGQAFSATVVRALAVTVWTLAGVAVWRSRHRLGAVLVPAVLGVTPFVLLAAQSYGGEAIYRVFLFSVPWCAYLIADLVVRAKLPTGQTRRGLVLAAAVLALAGASAATMQGRHGQLMVDEQTTGELAAARHLYANATPGATIALATPDFPSRLTGNYDQFNGSVPVGEPDLVKGAELRDAELDRRYLPGIEDYLRSFHGTTAYLVVSDGMRAQAEYFGYLPDGSLDSLEEALAGAPGWSVFYHHDGVAIYQYQG